MIVKQGAISNICSNSHGPSFGCGDISIRDGECTSNLGASYTHSQYVYRSVEARSFLAGSLVFNSDEIEIYHIEKSSTSLLTNKQWSDLKRICQLNDKWRLIYKASRDGFEAKNFHEKCDNKSFTLSLFKVKETNFIFGAYASVSWDSSSKYKSDPSSFIFSLSNEWKMNIKSKCVAYSILCLASHGPSFGAGDICIRSNANKTVCSSNLGS